MTTLWSAATSRRFGLRAADAAPDQSADRSAHSKIIMREKLIADYHQMLSADVSITAEFLASLKEMMRSRKLVYGDREFGVALRPHVLTRRQYKMLTESCEVLAGAFNKVASALLAKPERMKDFGLTDREIKLALVNPRYSATAVNSRLDAFIHDDEISFVEYNAENPSSLSDQSGLNAVLHNIGAMKTTAERYQLREFFPVDSLLDVLLRTFREWGGTGVPRVAVLDWKGLPTSSEFVLLRDFFNERGVPAIICAPEELEYQEGKLRCGDFAIDLVYKRVVIHEFLERSDDSHPLIRAYVHGDVCLVNSFRCKIVHKKSIFELLTDETYAGWFTSQEREVLQRTLPWTRRVAPRETQHRGRRVDLIEHVRKNRQLFLLKPNDDYGGRGISFGDQVTTSEWDTALEHALANDYVVQEKIKLRTEVFPVFGESGWSLQPMYVDTNPFLFAGKVKGALVRLSDSPVVNVTSGGGETGFYVIDGKKSDES